jgi:hypothetical protein
MASMFKIKSVSRGNGTGRHPILTRTKATIRYGPDREDDVSRHVEDAAARMSRRIGGRFFTRLDKQTGGGRGAGRRQKPGASGVSFRDGEVAGSSMPQIAEGNKGRTMLEKMGWASGMALGADENKGILEPVAQVMKRSKAGLGGGGRIRSLLPRRTSGPKITTSIHRPDGYACSFGDRKVFRLYGPQMLDY